MYHKVAVLFPLMGLPLFFSGCAQALPGAIATVDDIATQDAVTLVIDKEAFQKNTDVKISIEVINKDPLVMAPLPPPTSSTK